MYRYAKAHSTAEAMVPKCTARTCRAAAIVVKKTFLRPAKAGAKYGHTNCDRACRHKVLDV
jgi:hypothetical protein